jgi:hypothetical protein
MVITFFDDKDGPEEMVSQPQAASTGEKAG